VVTGHADLNVQGLRAHCARALPALFVLAHIVRVADIPRNDMGRIIRNQLEGVAPARS
jgi:acyl-coenzyme A synthetase/AMP-(fatty) acid ligase